jgi:hypothetical protein
MGPPEPVLNMHEPVVFHICVQGELDAHWTEYFHARSLSVCPDAAGAPLSTLVTEPVDQAALVGIINYLNGLRLPLISVQCLPADEGNLPMQPDNREV